MIALDFETEAIDGHRPPRPVGFAVGHGKTAGEYLSWGHPIRNNSTEAAARLNWKLAIESKQVWFFNAGFDCAVAERWGHSVPWDRVHDAQILAFLGAPLATRRGLKDLCESELGIKPEERARLYEWIRASVPEAKRLGDARLGAFISKAPGDLVGEYAKRDVLDTLALARHWKRFVGTEPYERERALLPILAGMKRMGIPIARKRLERDAVQWEGWLEEVDRWLKRRLGIRDLKPALIVAAIEKKGLAKRWVLTETGGKSIAKEALQELVSEGSFADPLWVNMWVYRSYLAWTLQTFVRPWLAQGEDAVHPTWNAVFGDHGGAVTGRLSSRPNAQNLPKAPAYFEIPKGLKIGQPPNLREYIEAPPGYQLVGADISQQELRILGHFVPSIGQWFRENPKLDLHTRVQGLIREVSGVELPRHQVKVVNFCTLYGGGARAISTQGQLPYAQAQQLKRMHAEALPGIGRWDWEMHRKPGLTFRTVGGREYTSVEGKEYRDRNYIIQGSAADQLKELMIAVDTYLKSVGGWMPLTAHDELLTCVPRERVSETKRVLHSLIQSTGLGGSREMFSVPMLGETYSGKRWTK